MARSKSTYYELSTTSYELFVELMALTKEQEKKLLIGLLALLAGLVAYRFFSGEQPKTAPLTYTQGMVVSSPVRKGLSLPSGGTDPLLVFLERREERYPGVARDIFRMMNPAPKAKPAPPMPPVIMTLPTPTIPVKTPEEIAADLARADLSKFRFLGYLTDKDSSLFLSKDGETFIAKSGDTLLKNYKIKAVGNDFVVLYDTITKVEVRIELTGSGEPPQQKSR